MSRLLTLLRRRGGTTPLFEDLFTTDRAAGSVNGTPAEPGPGNRVATDTGNQQSIASAKLHWAGRTSATSPSYSGDGVARARRPGRTLRLTTNISLTRFGWMRSGQTNADAIGYGTSGGNLYVLDTNSTRGPIKSSVSSNPTTVEAVMCDRGGMVFVDGGSWSQRTLLWKVSSWGQDTAIETPLTPIITYGPSGGPLDSDTCQRDDYGGVWAQEFGLATASERWPASIPVTQPSTGDTLVEVRWIVATGETQETRFRRADDNNCWLVRCPQSSNKIFLYEVTAGVEVEYGAIGGIANTWNNANEVDIKIRAEGGSIVVAVNGVLKQSITNGTYNSGVGGLKVSGCASLESVASWPLTGFPAPTVALPPKNILAYGDSKANGSGDATPPVFPYGGYPPILTAALQAATGAGWYERPFKIAHGGNTTAQLKALIDADLAAATGTPDYILVNATINDTAPLPVEATWKTNYAYILDAFHAKWPNAVILVAYVWGIGRDSDCNTLALWIDAVLSPRPWARVGLDERIVLKGSDNGASAMFDTVHPNRLGYIATAAAWQMSMGY